MPDSTPDRLPAGRFTWEKALRAVTLSRRAVATGYALATWADKDGTRVRPGVDNLTDATRCSKRTVMRALAELQEAGYIEQVSRGRAYGRGGGGFASEYRLTLPSATLLPQNNMPPVTPSSGESYPQADAETPQNKVPTVQNKVPSTTEQGANGAEQGATGGTPPDQLTPDQLTPRHDHQAAEGHQGRAALAEAVDNRKSKHAHDDDPRVKTASAYLSGRPDLGISHMSRAEELRPGASSAERIILAAELAGMTTEAAS